MVPLFHVISRDTICNVGYSERIKMPIWDSHVVYFIEDGLVIDLLNTKLATRIVDSPKQDVTYTIVSRRIVGLV